MLEINLLPVREARRKADLRQYVMGLLLVLIVVGCAVGFFHNNIVDQIETAQTRVRQMQTDIDQFKPQLEQVAAFKKRKAELEKKIDVIDGLDKARTGPVRVLNELSKTAPDRLWLTQMVTKGSKIEMQGQSLDYELVALFVSKLQDSEYFADVDLEGSKLGNEKGGLKLVSFKISAKLVTPKAKTAANQKNKAKRA